MTESEKIIAWLEDQGRVGFAFATCIRRGDHHAIADQSRNGGDACGSIHASGGGKANRQNNPTQGIQP